MNCFLFVGFIMAVHLVSMVFCKRVPAYLKRRLAQPPVHHLVVNADAPRNAQVLGAALLTLRIQPLSVVALLT